MSHKGHFPFWKKDLGKHCWLELSVMSLLVKALVIKAQARIWAPVLLKGILATQ